jgi:hypothetical protein
MIPKSCRLFGQDHAQRQAGGSQKIWSFRRRSAAHTPHRRRERLCSGHYRFELKFGPDSTNNRAGWVHLIVDDDLKPSKDKISEVNAIANRVCSALLRENLNFCPYVDVRRR